MKISNGNQNSLSSETLMGDDGKLRRGRTRRKFFDATMAAGARCQRRGRGGSGSGSATPLWKWKLHEAPVTGGRGVRRVEGDDVVVVSARKLASSLWRLAAPVTSAGHGGGGVWWQCKPLDWLGVKLHSSSMEAATKWDTSYSKPFSEVQHFGSPLKPNESKQIATISVASALQVQLVHARKRVEKLETDRSLSKKKLEFFLRKLGEETASWKRIEREKVRVLIDDLKRERRNCRCIDIGNSKLLNDLSDAKLLSKLLKQKYEKERKTRELLEDVCDRLAKEIEADESKIKVLKSQRLKIREEVEEDRKMLQIAEAWREERIQMKLLDAKLVLDKKLCELNTLVQHLANFLRSRNIALDVKSMNDQEYTAPESDDIHKTHSADEKHNHLSTTTSNITTASNARVSEGESALQSNDLQVQWSSSGARNPHVARAMKGCIEFPRGVQRSGCLKSNLLEAKLAGQRTQLRSILKQRN